MRHLGIDYGRKRIGLAMTDAGGSFVSPLDVIEVGSPAAAYPILAKLIEREGIEVLVVGLPLNMDGSEGPSAAEVRQWCDKLGQVTELDVVLVDERRSSVEADAVLADQKRVGRRLTHKGKKRRRDALAAAHFLLHYVEGRLGRLA